MKTRLYRKFVKLVCAGFDISRKQLFSRNYKDCVLYVYKYDPYRKKLDKMPNKLTTLTKTHPLSSIWHSECVSIRWLLKYWKHSRHRAFVQCKLDLGYTIEDAVAEVIKSNPRYVRSY